MNKFDKVRNNTINATIAVLSKAKACPKDANKRLIIALKGRGLSASQKKQIVNLVKSFEEANDA